MFANLTRRKLQLLSGPLLLAVLSACAHFPDAGLAPVQSPNDEREYRLLTLENQMQVSALINIPMPQSMRNL